jgi:hypothetical protein
MNIDIMNRPPYSPKKKVDYSYYDNDNNNNNIAKIYTCSLYLSIVGSIILTTSLAYYVRSLNIFNE